MLRSIFTVPVISLLALSISACQPTVSDAADSLTAWSCVTEDSPFSYSACQIDSTTLQNPDYSLQLFWQQPNSVEPLLTFDKLLSALPTDQTLAFAMNAGMYDQHYAPIGYTVIEGKEIKSLNLKSGGGNFHLLPNGVIWWNKQGEVQITESNTLSAQLKSGEAQPWYASQSGPMLVIDNQIHPKFNADGTSLKFRNGVGVCTDGSLQFINSNEPVSFYQFASLFKEQLKCPNALFLDGGIASALYAPSIDKQDKKDMGVMIGVVETKR